MEHNFVAGLFALYVFFLSLGRFLAESDPPSLIPLKKRWGRTRGLALHFVTRIALPLTFGIVFLGQAVAGFVPPSSLSVPCPIYHQQLLSAFGKLTLPGFEVLPSEIASNGEIALLLSDGN